VVRLLDHSAPQPARSSRRASSSSGSHPAPAGAQVHSCYEAGPFGYGLHRTLLQLGVHNLVVQPVCLDEHHKGVNHDKSDAKELALRLDRYVAGNSHALGTVRVPTPEERTKTHRKPPAANNSNAKSIAWPRKVAACCSPKAGAKRKVGGRTDRWLKLQRQTAGLVGRAAGVLPPRAGHLDH